MQLALIDDGITIASWELDAPGFGIGHPGDVDMLSETERSAMMNVICRFVTDSCRRAATPTQEEEGA